MSVTTSPAVQQAMVERQIAAIVANKVNRIETTEPGWPLCRRDGDAYAAPMRVSQELTLDEAMKAYDWKVMDDAAFVAARIFFESRLAPPPRPEDRFAPEKVKFSVTHQDWPELVLLAAERAHRRTQPYGSPGCFRLTNEWTERILPFVLKNHTECKRDSRNTKRRSAAGLLSAYVFVPAEVFLLPERTPTPGKIFHLKFSREWNQHFYVCYTGGVSKPRLSDLLTDCQVIS